MAPRKKRGKYKKHKENPTSYRPKTDEERRAFWYNDVGERWCSTGKHHVAVENFGPNKNGVFGLNNSCRECANKRARELHKVRGHLPHVKRAAKEYYCKRAYGLTYAEYHSKLANQHNRCAICAIAISGKQAHLDHDHTTGVLRDFLCTNCNRGLGHLMESETILAAAIAYLRRHQMSDVSSHEEGTGL